MADQQGLLPPCRWWDAVTLGVSRDVYHISRDGAANRLTGVGSMLAKAAGVVAFALFLREKRRNSGSSQGGGGNPPPA